MGLPGDVQEASFSDTAPFSPEQVARCKAKNTELNESLGLEVDDSLDPAMLDEDEGTVSDNSLGFLILNFNKLQKKMHCWIVLWHVPVKRRIQVYKKLTGCNVHTLSMVISAFASVRRQSAPFVN